MKTVAEKQGDGSYILNGSKNFITVGPEAEHIIVFAVTTQHPEKPRHTAFIVKRGIPGFSLAPHDEKMGIKAAHSCSIFFDNVRVPPEYLLSDEGAGFKVAMVTLDGGFLTDSATDLTKWRFPATNLNAGGYLVVFASNQDRRTPGAPLHTNFKLRAAGGFLAAAMLLAGCSDSRGGPIPYDTPLAAPDEPRIVAVDQRHRQPRGYLSLNHHAKQNPVQEQQKDAPE